jgi:flavin-dependent dehydrogenase
MAERQRSMLDVVVVGAGPAGSSVAIALAQRGWDVLLVERERLPRHKVCGEFLSPEAQASLRNLQVTDDLAALGPVPFTEATLTAPLGATIEMPLPGAAWGLSRYALDATLAAAAVRQGAEMWSSTTVTACERTGDHFSLRLRERGQVWQVQARAVLMACGRYSSAGLPPRAASKKNVATKGWRRCVGLKCHYEQITMPARVELFLVPGGYAGINPIEGNRANVCLLMTYKAFEQAGKSVPATIAAVAERHPRLARRLAMARPVEGTVCAVAPVDTGRAAQPFWDGVACLGDTASMIAPLCGDGMAMALRSAELCVPSADAFLRGSLSLAGWADNYSQAWRAEFAGRVRLGRLLQSLLTTPLASEALVHLGRQRPALVEYLVRATRGGTPAALPFNVG